MGRVAVLMIYEVVADCVPDRGRVQGHRLQSVHRLRKKKMHRRAVAILVIKLAIALCIATAFLATIATIEEVLK
jgi:hypothetical protein